MIQNELISAELRTPGESEISDPGFRLCCVVALALCFAYYNFCRIHSSIRVTPAMEAGINDYVWDLAELIA